ncbi:hypothetical protein KKG31_08940, partial [Patescibacteria group bacterium]|nr:hypothetical protein [Patescibacteria group bacterium]
MVRIPKKWQAEEFQPTEVDEAEEQLALEKARFEADTEAEQERERLAKQKPSLGIAKRLREFGMRGTIEARLREAGYEMADLEDEEQQDIVAEIVETSRQEAQRLTDKGFEESAASAKELLRRMREAKDKGVPFREFDPAQELGAEEELKRNQNQYSRSAEAALKRMRRQLAW